MASLYLSSWDWPSPIWWSLSIAIPKGSSYRETGLVHWHGSTITIAMPCTTWMQRIHGVIHILLYHQSHPIVGLLQRPTARSVYKSPVVVFYLALDYGCPGGDLTTQCSKKIQFLFRNHASIISPQKKFTSASSGVVLNKVVGIEIVPLPWRRDMKENTQPHKVCLAQWGPGIVITKDNQSYWVCSHFSLSFHCGNWLHSVCTSAQTSQTHACLHIRAYVARMYIFLYYYQCVCVIAWYCVFSCWKCTTKYWTSPTNNCYTNQPNGVQIQQYSIAPIHFHAQKWVTVALNCIYAEQIHTRVRV